MTFLPKRLVFFFLICLYVKALIYRIIRWANINWIQVVSAPMMNLPNTVMPPHMMVNSGYPHDMVNSGYVHFNPMQQVVTSSDPLACFNVGYVFISLPLWSLSYNFWFTNNLCVFGCYRMVNLLLCGTLMCRIFIAV